MIYPPRKQWAGNMENWVLIQPCHCVFSEWPWESLFPSLGFHFSTFKV